jgi:hypothetical protein
MRNSHYLVDVVVDIVGVHWNPWKKIVHDESCVLRLDLLALFVHHTLVQDQRIAHDGHIWNDCDVLRLPFQRSERMIRILPYAAVDVDAVDFRNLLPALEVLEIDFCEAVVDQLRQVLL